ncbi:hypothetical protein HYT24_02255, partial [Candidatus Pacearchaeota archaeon]|nr:hypothetical protein [Candidatus Pacearchaeota archaeon]
MTSGDFSDVHGYFHNWLPKGIWKPIAFAVGMVVVSGSMGVFLYSGKEDTEEKQVRKERTERVMSLVDSVKQKAFKGDNVFTFDEQVDFLKEMNFQREFIQGRDYISFGFFH